MICIRKIRFSSFGLLLYKLCTFMTYFVLWLEVFFN